MGKKYVPVRMSKGDYRIYLDNVEKVYRVAKRPLPAQPPNTTTPSFLSSPKNRSTRKSSFQTEPGTST